MAADFRADMAEKRQRMTVKKGGTLFGKTPYSVWKIRIHRGRSYDEHHSTTE
jgi:hypothetical protein